MKILKALVCICFVAIILFIFLAYIQLPEVREYEHEISSTFPFYTGLAPLDVVSSSVHYLMNSPTVTSGLLIFLYFVGVGVVSYIGSILGVIVAIIEKGEKADFVFIFSFTGCIFFAIFTTLITILV